MAENEPVTPQEEKPVIVKKTKKPGRPRITDEQYTKWLDDMAPFLKLGNTIWHSVDDAGLQKHLTTIYEKYRLNDWFAQKIDNYRSYPGKTVNNILSKLLIDIETRMKQQLPITDEDMRNVRFMAEKHRTAQTYFVSRTETAEADPAKVGKILDTMESDNVVEMAQKAINEKNTTQEQKQTNKICLG